MKWEEYAEKTPYFISEEGIPELLEELLKHINRPFSIINLGCGDGTILYALYNKGLLKNANRIVGVDISEERINRLKKSCPFAEGFVSDVQDLKIRRYYKILCLCFGRSKTFLIFSKRCLRRNLKTTLRSFRHNIFDKRPI